MFDDWWYLYLFWKEELTYYILIFSFFTYELWYSTGWLFRAWLHYLVLLIVRRFRFTCYISNDLLAWRCLVLLSVAQHCSALLSIAQHCSALLSITQHCSSLLSIAQLSNSRSIFWHLRTEQELDIISLFWCTALQIITDRLQTN